MCVGGGLITYPGEGGGLNSYSAEIDFSRRNLTSVDVRF